MHCTEKRLNLVEIFMQLRGTCTIQIRVNLLWLNLHVRTMSSPLLWFPGSLYLGVNCWVRVKLRHSNDIFASERYFLHKKRVSVNQHIFANLLKVTYTYFFLHFFIDLCIFVLSAFCGHTGCTSFHDKSQHAGLKYTKGFILKMSIIQNIFLETKWEISKYFMNIYISTSIWW